MTGEDVRRLGEELGLDAVGVARAEAYDDTERAIRDRRSRGLFAEMKFTMAQLAARGAAPAGAGSARPLHLG
jgi:hypothetical protein